MSQGRATHASVVLAWVAASLVAAAAACEAATPVHRCVVDGTVTFQRDPCPTGMARKQPTAQQLNAERKRRQEAAGAASAAAAATGHGDAAAPPAAAAGPAGTRESGRTGPAAAAAPYRCDGRTHCSQMRSCDEAKHFLRHCPGVQMDGDGDGIPCERQWCGR